MFILISILSSLAPPIAPKIPYETVLHGEKRLDNYAWLKDKESKQTIDYLNAENAYTDAMMAGTQQLQETLYQEMKGRINESDTSVPAQKGDYFYYKRQEPGKAYSIYCRKKCSLCAPEEIIFDENEAAGSGFFSLGALAVSPDQNLIALTMDRKGNEINSLKIKDLTTGRYLPDEIPEIIGTPAWSSDGKEIFYTIPDEIIRPFKLYRHKLGTDPKEDVLVYEEKDKRFYLYLQKSKDQKFIFLLPKSQTTTEVYTLDPTSPDKAPVLILPRETDVKYSVESHEGELFLLTNKEAPDFKILRYREGKITEWIPPRIGIHIEDFEVFKNYMAILEREKGLQQIEIVDLKTGFARLVQFHEPVFSLFFNSNFEYCSSKLRFGYASLVTPDSIYDYDMQNHTFDLKKQEKVAHYCAKDYEEKRFFACAQDGTEIPISLVYKKDLQVQGLLLTGYGAYGISYPVGFSSERISLLDRGIAFAIAHVRGGGEGGRRWYDEGRLFHKKNTFTDFIAAAQKLVDLGITSPQKLVIEGRSAGGLLMGAVVNMRPDLFKAVIAGVPFVDVINTMSDPTIPLTVNEYEEWGDPADAASYTYIRSYSPYDNVSPKSYPHLLISGGLNDSRVGFWEPAKWAAKLRVTKTDSHLLLLKTEMGGGHFGRSGRYDALSEEAFNYAFIIKMIQN